MIQHKVLKHFMFCRRNTSCSWHMLLLLFFLSKIKLARLAQNIESCPTRFGCPWKTLKRVGFSRLAYVRIISFNCIRSKKRLRTFIKWKCEIARSIGFRRSVTAIEPLWLATGLSILRFLESLFFAITSKVMGILAEHIEKVCIFSLDYFLISKHLVYMFY